MCEIWKDIIGYEGIYAVSNRGRVKRIACGRGTTSGKILKHVINGKGYLSVTLCRDGIPRPQSIHHLVLETFIGLCPLGMECCHNDGNRQNSRLENLRWDTPSANRFDAVRHGTHVDTRGSRHGNAKLTETDVIEIKHLLFEGFLSGAAIGRLFGVSKTIISYINKGKAWKYV